MYVVDLGFLSIFSNVHSKSATMLLPAVIVETQPFVFLVRQSYRTFIQFSIILAMDLQFCAQAEVVQASEKTAH